MLLNLALGMVLIITTVVVHSGAMILIMQRVKNYTGSDHPDTMWDEIAMIACTVLVLFFATLIEVAIWAVTYLALQAMETFEAALYFSMVTFTTLGYGDISLDENWRLLSSVQGVNGIIIFGWTTALVVAVVQRLYQQRQNPD